MTPPAATAAGTGRALPRTVAPRHHRRVSGPSRSARGAAPTKRAAAPDPLAVRLLARGQALADSRFLDRLLRGRLWIGIVAAMLMGIVFMQVTMLSLNAGIGRAVERTSVLERQNTTLRAEVSRMESGTALDDVVGRIGMVQPADGSTHYVRAGDANAAQAAKRMTAPEAPVAAGSTTAGATAAAAPTTPGTTVPGTTTPGTAAAAATTPAPAAATPQAGGTPSTQAATPPAGGTASAPSPAAGGATATTAAGAATTAAAAGGISAGSR